MEKVTRKSKDIAKTYRTAVLKTPKEINENKKTNIFINREIAKIIETGTLKYNITLFYHNSKTITKHVVAKIRKIPKEPPEPAKNLAFGIGNKTITPSTFSVPKPIGKLLVKQVQKIKPKKKTSITRTNKRGFRK